MKILISSHFPFIPSGYAIQTERLISGLYKHYPGYRDWCYMLELFWFNYAQNKKQFYTVDDF